MALGHHSIEVMVTVKQLGEAIADALYEEKSYNLPKVCEDLGLASGNEEEAFSSKKSYVLRRLSDKDEEFVRTLAYKVLERYDSAEFRKVLGEFASDNHRLTALTRQNLLDGLILMERERGQYLHGRLDLVDFLKRIWPLDKMTSTDSRYSTAAEDIWKHMVANSDWDYYYLFDNYLGMLKGFDEDFLHFLEELVHPVVRESKRQTDYVEFINEHLLADGFKLQVKDYISGYPIYKVGEVDSGITKAVKNLIFAANGPKPQIVLEDSVSNDIRIVENADYCLVYNLPIPSSGLLWKDLIAWWATQQGQSKTLLEAERLLYKRLESSLNSPLERLLFYTYFDRLRTNFGEKLPALIPQVYLHYDPYTLRQLGGIKRLPRQRMDFLILFSSYKRIVIEVDGVQHYADGEKASPKLYSEMVAEDRRLRLVGYEVYRFGGYELQGTEGRRIVEEFFHELFKKYNVGC